MHVVPSLSTIRGTSFPLVHFKRVVPKFRVPLLQQEPTVCTHQWYAKGSEGTWQHYPLFAGGIIVANPGVSGLVSIHETDMSTYGS